MDRFGKSAIGMLARSRESRIGLAAVSTLLLVALAGCGEQGGATEAASDRLPTGGAVVAATPMPEPTDTPQPVPTDMPQPVPTDTPQPVPTDTPQPTPTPETGFGDGIWAVGAEIEPGMYAAASEGDLCYWARLSGFSGALDDISANEVGNRRSVVEIKSSDAGFETSGCGRWQPISEVISAVSTVSDGTWVVGDELSPGTYSAPGGDLCYWARLSGFDGDLDSILTNNLAPGKQLVTIEATDAGFNTNGCGEWTRVE